VRDIFLEYAANGRCREKLDVRAQVIPAALAKLTMSTGFSRLKRDTVADHEGGNALPDRDDRTSRFVTEYERRLHNEVPDPARAIIMQVGTTNAYMLYFDKDFSGADFRNGPFHEFGSFKPRHYRDPHHRIIIHTVTSPAMERRLSFPSAYIAETTYAYVRPGSTALST